MSAQTIQETVVATFGGGCFWCTEGIFSQLKGVTQVQSGYAGGQLAHPSYEQVCQGDTGHAEVVQVTFDPKQISYQDLLEIFFATHDPTQLNRQGNDVGTQYRSVIFTHDSQQLDQALKTLAELTQSGVFEAPIVTDIQPLTTWYPAEDIHENYFQRNPEQPYCAAVIAPKLAKFKATFTRYLKD